MYSVPYIENFASAMKFVAHLQNHQEAANSVRILRMPMCSSRYPQFARSFPAPLKVPIVLPNLVSVNQAFVVLDAFAELAAEGAVFPMESMEQELSDSPPIPPNVFLKFPHLRKLSLWMEEHETRSMRTRCFGAMPFLDSKPSTFGTVTVYLRIYSGGCGLYLVPSSLSMIS